MKSKTISIAALAALMLMSGCSASKDAASSQSENGQPLTFDQTSGGEVPEGVIFQDEISLSQEGGIPLDGSAPEMKASIDMDDTND